MIFDAVEMAGEHMAVGMIQIGSGVHTRRLEHRLKNSPHIKLFRPVYDRVRLARIMASCDALIHGSDAEPFGLVGLEGLASGLPLIVPDEGDAPRSPNPASPKPMPRAIRDRRPTRSRGCSRGTMTR
ncbi:glycosyltransferase [Sphingomonas hankookensis]